MKDTDRRLRELGFRFHVPEIEEVDVLVVDDDSGSLSLIKAFVERIGHPVRAYTDPEIALQEIHRGPPPKILLTDIVMPKLSGIDLVSAARAIDPDVGVVLTAGVGDAEAAAATMRLGVSSYLTKPLDLEPLRAALQRAFLKRAADDHQRAMLNWMYEAMDRNAAEIRRVSLGTLTSLINALDARSPHFHGHSQAVGLQAAAIAHELGLDEDEVDVIRTAGLLHDIGMIGVPESVVDKQDELTADEMSLIRTHPAKGAEIIEPMHHLGPAIAYVLEHHERWDGSGYPEGKRGNEISLGGQIVGIAEAWTGIIESRAYRDGRSREEGMEILSEHRGRWFTDTVTEALVRSDVGLI
jgi:putative nucleotidyltransferase with HDIG domain